METKTEAKILSGFVELMPAEQILFNQYLQIIKDTYEEFGFVPLESPIIEYSNVLLAKIGDDTKKEIYRFQRNDDDLSLRFDLTVPLARFVAMNGQNLSFPFRRYQIGKVFRGERPQKGRYREFYQCDIDIIGNGKLGLINDAEIPAVIYRLFSKLNLGEFVIRISNRKVLTGLVESFGYAEKTDEVLRIVDKLEKIGKEGVVDELVKTGLDMTGANKVIEFVRIFGTNEEIVSQLKNMGVKNSTFDEGVSELEVVLKKASEFGVPEKNLKLDLAIARGLSYYTGTVYETVLMDERVSGSVCSGGRYDDLAESYTDVSYPGVGISIGLTRLFSQLLSAGVIAPEASTPSKVMVLTMDSDLSYALEVATNLREAGIKTEVYTEDEKFKKKLNFANKIGVPYVAIIGEEEIKLKKVALKNMKTGDQDVLSVEEVIKKLR